MIRRSGTLSRSALRVLHLPTSVGGMAWALSQGERRLGLDSQVLVASQNYTRYQADINLDLQNRSGLVKLARLARVFWSIRKQFDVFHFNFGQSLIHAPTWGLNQVDLPFYPRGARLFATYNGCDARQKYPTMRRAKIAACHEAGCYGGRCNSGKLDEHRRRGIEKMSRHVDHIWAVNPDLLHFLPPEKASFLPYACTNADQRPAGEVGHHRLLRVVHAPTDRAAKGTAYILRALERVQTRFPGQIEVQLVEGLPHARALEIYRQADLVIDQVMIGWYGGLAVEVMQLGKPVIARIEEADLKFLPEGMADDVRATLITSEPARLEETIVRCLEDREMLRERGRAAPGFVERWHKPEKVAAMAIERYRQVAA
jgi:hypothetical protein